MPDYSGYQIKRPHALSPLTSVYEAVATDGRPGRFALKIFHPPAATTVRRLYAIEGWLLAAERQQQSARKDGMVLEVLAFGRCEAGAFTVSPWQERCLEPLVKTLGVKGDTLRALAECLLTTLEQWEKQTGGPHGNLKAANIFLSRSGPLVGMTAQFSDPWYLPGGKAEVQHTSDLAAIGAILAQIVRRRPPGAWPIEEAPEWKALGHGGKGWLDFCNFLLNPSPNNGEFTIAAARRHLGKVPKDTNPVKTAVLIGAAVVMLGLAGVVAFARFGNPIYMPVQIERLAVTLKNPRVRQAPPIQWAQLCAAWDTWLIDLQSNESRLLRTEGLWEKDDQLKAALQEFVATANELRPEALVPEAANEKRLGVLGNTPPPAVFNELLLTSVGDRVAAAGDRINKLNGQLENWQRWEQMRALQKLMEERGYTQAATALASRLPPARSSAEYGKLNTVRTLKFFNDLSLDDTGTLPLAQRWSEITHHSTDMETSGDRIQKAMSNLILARLADKPSVGDFADSLSGPLEEMRQRRKLFLDPAVVRERFLKESTLLAETTVVTEADFPRWEQELVLFSLVPAADDPRLAAELDASVKRLPVGAADLEPDAPVAEPDGLPTLNTADFDSAFKGLTVNLKTLRERKIVRRDLPDISEETTKAAGAFKLLEQRLEVTLSLLKPEIWLARVAQAVGKFAAAKERWTAWQQATLTGVTPAVLRNDRPRFRQLRASERQIREWLDELEGPAGFGALPPPDLTAASPDTAAALQQLEAARREQAATAVAAAAEWRAALPTTPWAAASAPVRAPLEAHRVWLAGVADFAVSLDRLNTLLVAGFGWPDGVSEVAAGLARHGGLDQLTGRPAEWNGEAKELARLATINERAGLTTAAQSGGLSRKLMAWRRLGALADWPAGVADFDFDGAVVTVMREIIQRDLKDEARRGSLIEEMAKEMRRRWNRAARVTARDEKQLTAMFDRMPRAGVTEKDLDEPVAYNLELWRLKRSDWNEANLGRLRIRRDAYVEKVRALPGVTAQSKVDEWLKNLTTIKLVGDPNLPPAPSTLKLAGWTEELTDEGLGLKATWAKGSKKVAIEYKVVQPTDGSPAFYLAKQAIAVKEFVDLLSGGARHDKAEVVLKALPRWMRKNDAVGYDIPIAWKVRSDNKGFEVNTNWILRPTSALSGLQDNAELRARPEAKALDLALAEKPTEKSPLQQVSGVVAEVFAVEVLGARLPTLTEWKTVAQLFKPPAQGFFRGKRFADLWHFLDTHIEGGQKVAWRPNTGVFLTKVEVPGQVRKVDFIDTGEAGETEADKLWFAPVDTERAQEGGFYSLYGNVWIFLKGAGKNEFYVAGGSALSPPKIDIVEPHKVEASDMIGSVVEGAGYSDVGLRPAFAAPPGFIERFQLLSLVKKQEYLTL